MRLLTCDYSFDTELAIIELITTDCTLDFEPTIKIRVTISYDGLNRVVSGINEKIADLNSKKNSLQHCERQTDLCNYILMLLIFHAQQQRFNIDYNFDI